MKVGSKVRVVKPITGMYSHSGWPVQLTPAREVGDIVTVSAFLTIDGKIGEDESAGGITLVEDDGAVSYWDGSPVGHALQHFEEIKIAPMKRKIATVGEKVKCITDEGYVKSPGFIFPVIGNEYTVRAVFHAINFDKPPVVCYLFSELISHHPAQKEVPFGEWTYDSGDFELITSNIE